MATSEARGIKAVASGATAVATLPFRAGGVLRMTVIAKATFLLNDGSEALGTRPDPIIAGGAAGEDPRAPGDLVPYLGQAEAFFHGAPIEARRARFAVLDGARPRIDKTIEIGEPRGLSTLDLAAHLGPRATGPGGLDRRGPILSIPDGFDWSSLQRASHDQRCAFFEGDEWIILEGLIRGCPRLATRLPGARGLARVYGLGRFGTAEGQPLILHADTLVVDGTSQRCTLTFRGVFPLASEEALDAARIVAGVELPGRPLSFPDPATLVEESAPATMALPEGGGGEPGPTSIVLGDDEIEIVESLGFGGTLDLTPRPDAPRAELPFAAPIAAPAVIPAPAPAARPIARPIADDDDDDGATGTLTAASAREIRAALPFVRASTPAVEPPRPAMVPPPAVVPAPAAPAADDDDESLHTFKSALDLATPAPPARTIDPAAPAPPLIAVPVEPAAATPVPPPPPPPPPPPIATPAAGVKKGLYGRFNR